MSFEERASELAGKATYAAAGGTIVFGFTLNEIAVAVGIIATIITAGVNWYYRHKHWELEQCRANTYDVPIRD